MFLWPGLASPPISGEGAAGAGAGLIPSQGWGCSSPGALSSALTRLREDFPRHLAHRHHQAEREETPEGLMELWAQAGNHSPSVGSVPASLSLLPWGQGHPRQWGCHWQGGVAVFRAGRGALSPHLQMEHLYLS